MLTSSGIRCDVCGNYILGLFKGDVALPFTIPGVETKLHCHTKCKQPVVDMSKTEDYSKLPKGPLKTLYEEQDAKGCVVRSTDTKETA